MWDEGQTARAVSSTTVMGRRGWTRCQAIRARSSTRRGVGRPTRVTLMSSRRRDRHERGLRGPLALANPLSGRPARPARPANKADFFTEAVQEMLSITIERLDDGEVSPYLTDALGIGDKLELRGPIGGYFVWDPTLVGPLFLVAGGSGIVPLMAMLRTRAAASPVSRAAAPATLLYSSRGWEDVIYREEFAGLASDPGVRVIHTLTRSQPPGWTGFSRRIDADMLTEVAPAASTHPHIYVCGPTPLVESVAQTLVELGYEPGRVKTERFGPTGP